MFVFEYDHVNYRELLKALAKSLGVPFKDDRLYYPPAIANGFSQMIELSDGVQAMVFQYTYATHHRLKRKKINEEFYTLWFIEVDASSAVNIDIDNDRYHAANEGFSTALLTSSLFEASYEMAAGSKVRGINILLNNEWLVKYLGVDSKSGLLQKYLSLKASRITIEPLDAEYKKLMQDIIDQVDGAGQFKLITIQNRIMMLIERFFMRMATKIESTNLSLKLSRNDINRVMEIESVITKDVFNPAPYIPELAKMVNISETKLKNDFKTVYGIPIYQYFQKARMRAARDVLESNKYSIKQVALELGYTNLSNFSTAFKKEFGILPSELKS
ncbi:MAG: AraC family transcriptional regulator [Chitinophagaceae bacterium]